MPGARGPILVVDDDPDLLNMLERLLSHDGYEVVTAQSGKLALAACEEELPCLIIADLMLPHMDGEQLLGEFRRRYGDAAPPVALLSASAVRDEIAEKMHAAASIAKPFDMDEIRDVVSRFAGAPHRPRE